jgi:hypothetical protein
MSGNGVPFAAAISAQGIGASSPSLSRAPGWNTRTYAWKGAGTSGFPEPPLVGDDPIGRTHVPDGHESSHCEVDGSPESDVLDVRRAEIDEVTHAVPAVSG